MQLRAERGNQFTLGAPEVVDLAEMDVLLMRQDPPFDLAYITATHIPQHIHPQTLVVNNPVAVRNAPEKLYVTPFDGVVPPTLISSDTETIPACRAEHIAIILKPQFVNGAARVIHLKSGRPRARRSVVKDV